MKQTSWLLLLKYLDGLEQDKMMEAELEGAGAHRSGRHDWRGILDHFTPAVQLGLTATPRRKDNVDPRLSSVNPCSSTRSRTASTIFDHAVVEGEVKAGKRYEEPNFNQIIEIKAREKKRVEIFMSLIDPREKTLVFYATQDHALAIRDLIHQIKTSTDPNDCHRVTAHDGALGKQWLRDSGQREAHPDDIAEALHRRRCAERTSHCPAAVGENSMLEFKQIIGRGTRLYDGKDYYFTIYDFVKAHHHFSDPEWDGEPTEPEVCEKYHSCHAHVRRIHSNLVLSTEIRPAPSPKSVARSACSALVSARGKRR